MPRNTKRHNRPALVRDAKAFAEARMRDRPEITRAEALEWTARELGFPNWNLLTGYAVAHPHPAISGPGPDSGSFFGTLGHTVVVMFSGDRFAAKVLARLRAGPANRVMVLPDLSPENAAAHIGRLREDRKYEIRLICPVPSAWFEDPASRPLIGTRFWEAAHDLYAFGEDGLRRITPDAVLHSSVLLSFPGKRLRVLEERAPSPVGPQRPFLSPPLSREGGPFWWDAEPGRPDYL